MKKLLLIAAGLLTISNLNASLISIEYECKIGENTQIIHDNFEVPGERTGVIWGHPKPKSDEYYEFGSDHARKQCARRRGEFIKILKINNEPVQIEKKKLL